MAEYIDKETLISSIESIDWYSIYRGKLTLGATSKNALYKANDIYSAIDNIPIADVAPVRHGRWERDEWGSYLRRCSVCKKTPIYKDERGNSAAVYAGICINCGARMDGGECDAVD